MSKLLRYYKVEHDIDRNCTLCNGFFRILCPSKLIISFGHANFKKLSDV